MARRQADVVTISSPSGSVAEVASTPQPAPQTPATTAAPPPAYFTYTIQAGDTVDSIARAYGIDPNYIIWNNPHVSDNPNMLLVGATLVIPSTNGLVYNVTLGDNLNAIAATYGIDVSSIINYSPNAVKSPDSVIEGMVLVLPGAVPPRPAATPEPAAPVPAAVSLPEATPAPAPQPEPAPQPAPQPSVGYIWPFRGNITTYFSAYHPGIDIDGYGAYGAPIAAAASGTVVLTAWDDYGYGYHVIIQHDDGSQTQYAHLSDIYVTQGQYVNQGQSVGAMGSTGYSTGTHLMFNLYIGGVAVDPLQYLP